MNWQSKFNNLKVCVLSLSMALSAGLVGISGVAATGVADASAAMELSVTGDSYSRLVLFKEGMFPEQAATLIEGWKDIQATILPETGLIRLSGSSPTLVREAELAVLQAFTDAVEYTGSDPKLELKLDDSEMIAAALTPQIVQQNLVDIKNIGDNPKLDKSLSKTMDFEGLNANRGEETVRAEELLYEKWGWDIKEVTDDWKSHDIQRGSRDVVIAVVDSGIDSSHPDLKDSLIGTGKSFVPGIESTDDNLGHGTMIAGTISADGKLLGVGPGLGLVPYKVFDTGKADSSWVVEAIVEAVNDNVDVINLSLGTYKSLLKPDDQAALLAYKRALAYAQLKGVTVVASSGTDGLNISDPSILAQALKWDASELAVHAPGGLPDVITVSAYNRQHEKAFYSNYGLHDMIASPGGDYGSTWFTKGELNLTSMCLTTYPTHLPQSELSKLVGLPVGYEFMIGTSLAAPKVAASAGLLIAEAKERGYRLSPSAVKDMLFETANDYGEHGADEDFGVGGVNVYAALMRLNP